MPEAAIILTCWLLHATQKSLVPRALPFILVLTSATSAIRMFATSVHSSQRSLTSREILSLDVKLRCDEWTEFNIEGNPIPSFTELVLEVKPNQVTLVPDGHDQITSNHGWDTLENKSFLTDICKVFKEAGIRTSIFVDADPRMVEGAKACGADRVELYTEPYASGYQANREAAIAPFIAAAEEARKVGLGLNAGHDLSLENLHYYHQQIPWTDEVSIGHALICDALYLGLKETIKQYLQALQ